MTVNRVEIANSFVGRDDLSPTEEKIRDRCINAQNTANRVREEYDKLVKQFNNVRQQAGEKELELLTAEKHLEALVDLIVDLAVDVSKGES